MKKVKRTSVISNMAVWLGASIAVSEIMSGACIASIGMRKGLAAILIGHLISGLLFYLSGRIGGESRRASMACLSLSFGTQGAGVFAAMNMLQLTAWTAIMLHISARILTIICSGLFPTWFWCLIIGLAVIVWVFAEGAQIGRVNLVASVLLLVMTFVMCYHVIRNGGEMESVQGFAPLSFGSAIELSLAVPMSWVPLVADYTSKAEHPHLNNVISSLAYILGSIWMYSIGLAAALYCGHSDIIQLLVKSGVVRIGLLIVVLATVTTTFLDACSAGISAQVISQKYSPRLLAVIALSVATVASMILPLNGYDQFLYLLASVFVPMTSILTTDYFLLKKRVIDKTLDLGSMLLWAVGFVLYHLLMGMQLPVGSTFPLVLLLMVIRYLTEWPRLRNEEESR
ncbi:MAG: cytosine permease [Butyricicoccus sp.]